MAEGEGEGPKEAAESSDIAGEGFGAELSRYQKVLKRLRELHDALQGHIVLAANVKKLANTIAEQQKFIEEVSAENTKLNDRLTIYREKQDDIDSLRLELAELRGLVKGLSMENGSRRG